jgi:hypothetical protein
VVVAPGMRPSSGTCVRRNAGDNTDSRMGLDGAKAPVCPMCNEGVSAKQNKTEWCRGCRKVGGEKCVMVLPISYTRTEQLKDKSRVEFSQTTSTASSSRVVPSAATVVPTTAAAQEYAMGADSASSSSSVAGSKTQ